jgi:prepilin-type processing-associated H-X9-DG protein
MLRVSPSAVPLLGDGTTDNPNDPANLVLGKRSVRSMTDGPFGGPYSVQQYSDFGPAHGISTKRIFEKAISSERANLLFADGHVSAFLDKNHSGNFALNETTSPFEQHDFNRSEVFDGIISLGRRNQADNFFTLE